MPLSLCAPLVDQLLLWRVAILLQITPASPKPQLLAAHTHFPSTASQTY